MPAQDAVITAALCSSAQPQEVAAYLKLGFISEANPSSC